jgi:hypothetical protein
MRDRRGAEVTLHDLRARIGLEQPIDGLRDQRPRDRTFARGATVDDEQGFHDCSFLLISIRRAGIFAFPKSIE